MCPFVAFCGLQSLEEVEVRHHFRSSPVGSCKLRQLFGTEYAGDILDTER
jgi:hypothetical protein